MKKIYSIVLMAAMLLVGTNAWAIERQVSSMQDLETAWKKAASGDVIKLTTDISVTKTFWLGSPDKLPTAPRSLTLDLNGWGLECAVAGGASGIRNMFVISQGELNVITSRPGGHIMSSSWHDSNYDPSTDQEVFRLSGTDATDQNPKLTEDSTDFNGYYSHLIIGEGVTVRAEYMNAIVIDKISTSWPYMNTDHYNASDNTVAANGIENFGTYSSNVFNPPYTCGNFANGVRIDIYGHVWAKKYAIKVNGNVKKPDNTDYTPFLHIHNTGKLETKVYTSAPENAKNAVAAYSSGYARWLINGTCEGSTGVYVKSGEVDIVDATIKSNFEGQYQTPTETSAGASSAGCGIVIQSSNAYAGGMDVTIGGDTKVTAPNGYAIEEKVTTQGTSGGTKVDAIVIEGGTFEGGNVGTEENPQYGTIIITETTANSTTSTVAVVGGNVQGSGTTTTDDGVSIGGKSLEEYLAGQSGTTTHVTYVDNEQGGKTMVISEGDAPTGQDDVNGHSGEAVNWKHSDPAVTTPMEEEISDDYELAELEINQDYDQTLTIVAGKKLTVGRVVLGVNAKIIVSAGAKFIVTGTQGIVAPVDSNIVLQSTQTSQALFLFNPLVSSNREPRATVDMTVAAGLNDLGEDIWSRFAMPVKKLDKAWTKKNNYPTWLFTWDYNANDWVAVAGGSTAMVPWIGYTLSYNNTGEEVYTFKGNLVGNLDAGLNFVHEGYNFFGNSYSSYIDAKTLINGLADAHIDASVYMWDAENQGYTAATKDKLNNEPGRLEPFQLDVAPMQTFILQLRGADDAAESVNYASAIWNNPRYGVEGNIQAPRRRVEAANEKAYFQVVVTAANGKCDRINLTENTDYTDAYESGYDASKYFNEGRLNVYATIEGANYSDVVTSTLAGKTISMQTTEDVNYTLSFNHVEGGEYAIRDNATNQVIAVVEGATYEFAAQPNSIVEGRFEIINVNKMPTAIDNTEVKSNVKGIYTITGQFVGEDFNALPAGVYVVDGVKIVK